MLVDVGGPEDRRACVEGAGRLLAVFWEPDGDLPVVVDARCPHGGAPLQRGWIEQGAIVCPFHRYRFSPVDGHCENSARLRLQVYPVERVDGRFVADVPLNPLGTGRYAPGERSARPTPE